MGRKKKLENQSEAIVEAATILFGQYGFAKTTLDDIARKVGIGKATLYGDFSSKEEILLAVLETLHRQMLNSMQTSIQTSKSSALETVQAVLLKDYLLLQDMVSQHRMYPEQLRDTLHQLGRRFQESTRAMSLKKQKMLADLLEKAAANHEILPSDDYLHLAGLIITTIDGIASEDMVRSRAENKKLVTELLDIMLSGLKLPRNNLSQPIP
jgi:AcrR family transcriptional regulator